jgi:hypothetical protein
MRELLRGQVDCGQRPKQVAPCEIKSTSTTCFVLPCPVSNRNTVTFDIEIHFLSFFQLLCHTSLLLLLISTIE